MIKIASFPIEKYEEANKFMAKNPPRSTEKQSGVVFHNGHIVVIHDDGKVNPADREGVIKTQLEGDRQKLLITEQSLKVAEIALAEATPRLIALKPEGYSPEMSNTELKRILEKEGKDVVGLSAADLQSIRDTIAQAQNQVDSLDNEIRMDNHEMRRVGYSVKAWESMLA